MNYYISTPGGQPQGPYALDQLKSMWAAGSITADALYFDATAQEWKPVQTLIVPPSQPDRLDGLDATSAGQSKKPKSIIVSILLVGLLLFVALPVLLGLCVMGWLWIEDKKERTEVKPVEIKVASTPNQKPKTQEELMLEAVYASAKSGVSAILKSPASAQFAPMERCHFSEKFKTMHDGQEFTTITIKGWVDAQNSYGGLMRNHFKCSVYQYSEALWLAFDVELDD